MYFNARSRYSSTIDIANTLQYLFIDIFADLLKQWKSYDHNIRKPILAGNELLYMIIYFIVLLFKTLNTILYTFFFTNPNMFHELSWP